MLIHAVVNNDATTSFAGTMQFTDGAALIGTVPVSLSAGEAAAFSVSWKPVNGSRTVVAELKKGTEVVEKRSATFVIKALPVPTVEVAYETTAAVESSDKIQQSLAELSPAAADVSAPLFTLVDSGRSTLSNILDKQITQTKQHLGSGTSVGEVLGADAIQKATDNPTGTFWFILQTLYLYLLTILSFIISSAGVFYPVAACIVLLLLWKMINHYRKPAY